MKTSIKRREMLLKQYAKALNLPSTTRIELADFELLRAAYRWHKRCAVCKEIGNCVGIATNVRVVGNKLYFSYDTCPKMASKLLKREITRRVKLAGVPDKFTGCTFDNTKPINNQQRVFKQVYDLANQRKGIYLFGKPGSGKTMLSCMVLNLLASAGYMPIFITAGNLMRELNNFTDPNYIKKRQDIFNAEALFIDDLGAEKISDQNLTNLFDLLNARYNNEKFTLINGNFELLSLKGRIKDRYMADRIARRLTNICQPILLN